MKPDGCPFPLIAILKSYPHSYELLHVDVEGVHGRFPMTFALQMVVCVESPSLLEASVNSSTDAGGVRQGTCDFKTCGLSQNKSFALSSGDRRTGKSLRRCLANSLREQLTLEINPA